MLLYSAWRNLSLPTRIKIADALGIKKTGPTHVSNNVVESDGYAIQDVEDGLSVENLQRYLETDEINLTNLFTMTIDQIEGNTPVESTIEQETVSQPVANEASAVLEEVTVAPTTEPVSETAPAENPNVGE